MKARYEQFSSTLSRTQPSSSLTVKAGHTDSRQTGVALTPAEKSSHKQRMEGGHHNACKDKLIQRPSLCVSSSIHLSCRQYFDHFVQLNQISALQTENCCVPQPTIISTSWKERKTWCFPRTSSWSWRSSSSGRRGTAVINQRSTFDALSLLLDEEGCCPVLKNNSQKETANKNELGFKTSNQEHRSWNSRQTSKSLQAEWHEYEE